MKKVMMSLVISMFCCACASLVSQYNFDRTVYRGEGYTNTAFFASHHVPERIYLEEEEETNLLEDIMYLTSSKYRHEVDAQKKDQTQKTPSKTAGYTEYFDIIGENSSFSYQLLYQRPSLRAAGADDYYLALINIVKDIPAQPTVRATLDGQFLPAAFQHRFSNRFSVDVKLTRTQLNNASKNSGKLEILLQVDDKTYKVSFPGYYLRDVLTKTY